MLVIIIGIVVSLTCLGLGYTIGIDQGTEDGWSIRNRGEFISRTQRDTAPLDVHFKVRGSRPGPNDPVAVYSNKTWVRYASLNESLTASKKTIE